MFCWRLTICRKGEFSRFGREDREKARLDLFCVGGDVVFFYGHRIHGMQFSWRERWLKGCKFITDGRKCPSVTFLAFGFVRLVCALGRRPSAKREGDGAAQPHRQRSRRLLKPKRTHYGHLSFSHKFFVIFQALGQSAVWRLCDKKGRG